MQARWQQVISGEVSEFFLQVEVEQNLQAIYPKLRMLPFQFIRQMRYECQNWSKVYIRYKPISTVADCVFHTVGCVIDASICLRQCFRVF